MVGGREEKEEERIKKRNGEQGQKTVEKAGTLMHC